MKKLALLSTLALVLASPFAGADEAVRAAQAALQRAGYYTGAPDGELNAETRAALRRFQLGNQLEATGDLTPETAAALKGEPEGAQTVPQAAPGPAAPAPVAPPIPTPPADPRYRIQFAKTPFENAAVEVQAATVRQAQEQLVANRFYSGPLDGVPSPAFEEALLRYQASRQLPRAGRLDIDTLAAMRLLPVAKMKRPRVKPVPYTPTLPPGPRGSVRGIPLD